MPDENNRSDEAESNAGGASNENTPDEKPAERPTPPDELPGDRRTDGARTDEFINSAMAVGDILDESGAPDALSQSDKDDLVFEMLERNSAPLVPEGGAVDLSGDGATSSFGRLLPWALGLAAATGVAVMVLLISGSDGGEVVAVTSGSDGEEVAGDTTGEQGDATGEQVDPLSGSGDEPSSQDSGGDAPVTSTACEAERERQADDPRPTTMSLSSPDLPNNVMPDTFATGLVNNAYDTGFLTPAFEWTGVPQGTTELVLYIGAMGNEARLIDGDRVTDYSPEPRWTATGIDVTSSGLRQTSVSTGLPEGVAELEVSNVQVRIDGQGTSAKFIGADPRTDTFIFALFALCDPKNEGHTTYGYAWLERWAIDYAFIIANWR